MQRILILLVLAYFAFQLLLVGTSLALVGVATAVSLRLESPALLLFGGIILIMAVETLNQIRAVFRMPFV